MMLPGFTAEALLGKSKIYRFPARKWPSANDSTLHPARVCEPDCTCDTYDFGVPGTCAKLCFDPPYGEPYPVVCRPEACNPPCDKPVCGACTQTCAYPSGPNY